MNQFISYFLFFIYIFNRTLYFYQMTKTKAASGSLKWVLGSWSLKAAEDERVRPLRRADEEPSKGCALRSSSSTHMVAPYSCLLGSFFGLYICI
jgi:hypothetical protein